jgi:DNA-directed RNA polymerase specialized sigma24 family protein
MSKAQVSKDRMKYSSVVEYATAEDFQRLLASEMVDLFRLAFLLTGNAERAERCVIVTMRECLATVDVFKTWLPVWTRNALIRNGVRIVTGIPLCATRTAIHRSKNVGTSDDSAGLLQLSDFDRLVYVICVVERYPSRDCAALLGRSRQEVRDAQNRALRQIVAFEREWPRTSDGGSRDLCRPTHEKQSDLDGSCGNLLV